MCYAAGSFATNTTYSLCDGKRKQGLPCQRWSDCIRRDLRDEGYDPKAWTLYWDFGPCEPPSGSAVVWHYPSDATNPKRSFVDIWLAECGMSGGQRRWKRRRLA